jgi:hypothetical protein
MRTGIVEINERFSCDMQYVILRWYLSYCNNTVNGHQLYAGVSGLLLTVMPHPAILLSTSIPLSKWFKLPSRGPLVQTQFK